MGRQIGGGERATKALKPEPRFAPTRLRAFFKGSEVKRCKWLLAAFWSNMAFRFCVCSQTVIFNFTVRTSQFCMIYFMDWEAFPVLHCQWPVPLSAATSFQIFLCIEISLTFRYASEVDTHVSCWFFCRVLLAPPRIFLTILVFAPNRHRVDLRSEKWSKTTLIHDGKQSLETSSQVFPFLSWHVRPRAYDFSDIFRPLQKSWKNKYIHQQKRFQGSIHVDQPNMLAVDF